MPPLPQKGTPQESSKLALASKLDKIPTHEFIKYRTSHPREITEHTPENTTLASDWTENKARVARASTGNSFLSILGWISKLIRLTRTAGKATADKITAKLLAKKI